MDNTLTAHPQLLCNSINWKVMTRVIILCYPALLSQSTYLCYVKGHPYTEPATYHNFFIPNKCDWVNFLVLVGHGFLLTHPSPVSKWAVTKSIRQTRTMEVLNILQVIWGAKPDQDLWFQLLTEWCKCARIMFLHACMCVSVCGVCGVCVMYHGNELIMWTRTALTQHAKISLMVTLTWAPVVARVTVQAGEVCNCCCAGDWSSSEKTGVHGGLMNTGTSCADLFCRSSVLCWLPWPRTSVFLNVIASGTA